MDISGVIRYRRVTQELLHDSVLEQPGLEQKQWDCVGSHPEARWRRLSQFISMEMNMNF